MIDPGAMEFRASTVGANANKPSVLAKPLRHSVGARGRSRDPESGRHAPCGLLALIARFFQYRGWRCLGRTAVEGWLWRIAAR